MKQRKLIVSEEEIEAVARTLKRERTIKGRKVTKTPAKLREEAKRKVTNKLASSLVPKWSLYALRHSWATRALQNGVDPLTAAILMGHSDPSMLSKVYQHLALDPTHMRRQAVRAVKGYTEN